MIQQQELAEYPTLFDCQLPGSFNQSPLSLIAAMKKTTIYIADDGKEFRSEDECVVYELTIAAQKKAREDRLNLFLAAALSARAINLFDGPPGEGIPPGLLDNFDRVGFDEQFRLLLSERKIDACLIVKNLESFADLGQLIVNLRSDRQHLILEFEALRTAPERNHLTSFPDYSASFDDEFDGGDGDWSHRIPDSHEGSPY
jgi:hypothetical protein